MSRQTYSNEVVTEIPRTVTAELKLKVISEISTWCKRSCDGGFYISILDPKHGDNVLGDRLAINFETKTDASRFQLAFGSKRPDQVKPNPSVRVS